MTDEHHAEAILRDVRPATWMYTKPGCAPKYGVRGLRLTEGGWTETPLYPASAILDAVREAMAQECETFASIIQWGDETFGPCEQDRVIERAWEEWQEMISPGADVPIEAVDVIIVLLRIPGIADAIQRKMAINRKRQWKFRGDGTGYHIPAAPTPQDTPQ